MTNRLDYPQEHFVAAGDSSIWVGEQPGEEPAIVLLHGFPDDATIYDKLVPFLAGRRVVAIDFGGYGRSPRDAEPWSEGRPEAELVAVLDELAITQATLVGHDASVPVAINVALDNPERVAKLVLLNGYFHSDPDLKLPDMIRLFGTPELSLLSDAIMDDQQLRGWLLGFSGKQFGIDPSGPDSVAEHSILAQYFGSENQPDARVAIRKWTATLYPGLALNDARVEAGDLGRLTVPVVVAFGEGDPYLTPTIAAHIGALFPHAAVEGVADSSHWPQWDQPELVASKIL